MDDLLTAPSVRCVPLSLMARWRASSRTGCDARDQAMPNWFGLIGLIAHCIARPGTRSCDLRCSLGAVTRSILPQTEPEVSVVAIDKAPAMIAGLQARLAGETELDAGVTGTGSAQSLRRYAQPLVHPWRRVALGLDGAGRFLRTSKSSTSAGPRSKSSTQPTGCASSHCQTISIRWIRTAPSRVIRPRYGRFSSPEPERA